MSAVHERTIAMPQTIVIVRCKRPGCKNEAAARGLCRSDFTAAWRLVSDAVTTWEELERRGKVDPKRPSARQWLLA